MWIYFISWTMHHIANKKFNETGYNLVTGSSLYAYLSHYFFIILIAVMVIRPYKISFIPALAVEIVGTNLCILVTYLIFSFIYDLIVPKKKKDSAEGTLEERAALMQHQEVTVEVGKDKAE